MAFDFGPESVGQSTADFSYTRPLIKYELPSSLLFFWYNLFFVGIQSSCSKDNLVSVARNSPRNAEDRLNQGPKCTTGLFFSERFIFSPFPFSTHPFLKITECVVWRICFVMHDSSCIFISKGEEGKKGQKCQGKNWDCWDAVYNRKQSKKGKGENIIPDCVMQTFHWYSIKIELRARCFRSK